MFSPISSGVIFSMIWALSGGPQCTTFTPSICSISFATVILDSWWSPDIKESQSMGSLQFIRAPLLMLQSARMTDGSGETFCALSATAASCRHKHLVTDPPIADSSGPEASINIFPAASSLIDKRVGLLSC